ncbi:hypothetical protein L596_013144 [Steinernema carpocapsae]|uniref:Histidine acid phosphatase n=1 Tax=Steinernema carpocapsae TaxID=34508 RepID=A0A4U5NZA1_STECR|nr:hypothetical protein L596_013144 [Steinernema carpocapsae]
MVAVNKDFYDLIQEKSGWNVTDAVNMFGLGNVLYIEKLYNMTLPSWVTDDVYNKIRAIGESGWDYAFGGAAYGMPEDVEMVKLYNGMLTTHIIENMKKMIGGKSKVLYHGFSGHDNTIAGFLRTLGAKDAVVGHETADYASTVVLELWKKKDGKHFVRVRWSANAETPFVSITDKVAGCPEKEYCPLDTFIQHREKYLVHDIAKACEVQPE